MRIAQVKIKNILGIAELECAAGQFNEITGGNGVNKTNFVNAIKAIIEGGHDATLLKNGEAKGEIVLVLDDGTELKKSVTSKTSRAEVTKNGVKMTSPQETIKALADLFSVNPIAFLSAPKADRARVLLESMPIVLDRERLSAIAGVEPPPVHSNVHALAVIDLVRKDVYDQRTGVNRSLDEKLKTIEQLRQAMPEVPAGVESTDETALETQLQGFAAAQESDLAELQAKVKVWMKAKDERVSALKQEHDAAIDELRAKIAFLNAAHQQEMAEIEKQTIGAEGRAQSRTADIKAHYAELRQPVETQLSLVRANRNATVRRQQTLETVKTLQEAAEVLEAQSREQTAALEAIDAYKLELLSSLPIPNLEVVNGEIYRNGVPFDRLNTAQRTDIAIEIAKLRAGKLGLVAVDGLECLDSDAYEAFEARALESGLQFFVTRVGQGALTIHSKEAASV